MVTPDLNNLRRKLSGQSPASSSSYRPLPPLSASGQPIERTLPAWVPEWVYPLKRAYDWVVSTAAPPDTPMGRVAAWAESTGDRFAKYGVFAGPIIGIGIALFVWFFHPKPPKNGLPGMLLGATLSGAMLGVMVPWSLFGFVTLLTRYWRWTLGYLGLLAFILIAGGIKKLL